MKVNQYGRPRMWKGGMRMRAAEGGGLKQSWSKINGSLKKNSIHQELASGAERRQCVCVCVRARVYQKVHSAVRLRFLRSLTF